LQPEIFPAKMPEIFLIEREGRALPPFTLPPATQLLKDLRLFYFQLLFLQQTSVCYSQQ
jgi:hypothetical protein